MILGVGHDFHDVLFLYDRRRQFQLGDRLLYRFVEYLASGAPRSQYFNLHICFSLNVIRRTTNNINKKSRSPAAGIFVLAVTEETDKKIARHRPIRTVDTITDFRCFDFTLYQSGLFQLL